MTEGKMMLRRVTITNLAPTGEGVSKTADGIGFVAGALPGEEVEAQVLEVRKKFWKGRTCAILSRSPLRRSGKHAEGCAGCDWSYFDLEAALRAKRDLFLETMDRIGELNARLFGDLSIFPSPLAYRLRNRFHVAGRDKTAAIGYFAPRTHRVESAEDCEALSDSMRAILPRLREAIAASGAAAHEVVTVEANHAAVEQALAAKKRWRAESWTVRHADALAFLGQSPDSFDVTVADPPRAGLSQPLTRSLSRRGGGGRLLYVSCEPATLARDLAALLSGGLHIRSARLYDLFPLTHRVEAVVALSASGAD